MAIGFHGLHSIERKAYATRRQDEAKETPWTSTNCCRARKLPDIVLGEDLSALSAHELETAHRAAGSGNRALPRSDQARHATKSAAENFFKR